MYVGEFFDKETNLYHMRARDYMSTVGRFTSMDEFEGRRKVPLTLNNYLYSNADPINGVDPSGFTLLSMIMDLHIRLPSFNINVGYGIHALAKATALACAMQAAITTVMGHMDVPLTGQKGCVGNQMRLQIQGSDAGKTPYTEGYVMMNIPAMGVSVLQVRQQMQKIYMDPPAWFPGGLSSELYSAIVRMSIALQKYPPYGTSVGGNIEREIIGQHKKLLWRLDLENLRGTNLKW